MSMNTYSLEETCALIITPAAACAILLHDAYSGPSADTEKDTIPEPVRTALDEGMTPWDCATDRGFKDVLAAGGWFNVSDAYDILENMDIVDIVHCSEFTGHANMAEGFEPCEEIDFEDDFIAMLVPENKAGLFRQAYLSPDVLALEYASRLDGAGGPGFPVRKLVMDVAGTYIC